MARENRRAVGISMASSSDCHECGAAVDQTKPMTVRVYVQTNHGDRPLCPACWRGDIPLIESIKQEQT